MATRQSIEKLLQQCEDTIRFAKDQLFESEKQEHYNESEYIKVQQGLENVYKELEELSHSANAQQREQLYRMRLQVQNLQNEMILQDR